MSPPTIDVTPKAELLVRPASPRLSPFGPPALLLLFSVLAPAAADAQRYLTQTYTEQQGLPSSTVFALDQDPSGRMWFLTRSGVTTYDGASWTLPTAEEQVRDRHYSHLAVDDRGRAWVAASWPSFGLFRLDDETVRPVPPPEEPPPPPEVYGTETLRLAVLDGTEGTRVAVGSATSGLYLWDGRSWAHFTRADGLPDDRVTALAAVGDRFFVGTAGGLAELGPDGLVSRPGALEGAPSPAVLALAPEQAKGGSDLWVVGRDWVGRLTAGRLRVVARDLDLTLEPPQDLPVAEPDGAGGLYLGSLVAVYHLDGTTGEVATLDEVNGLVSEGATGLLLDREKNLWVTTLRGVTKLAHRQIVSYDSDHGLLQDEVTAIEPVGEGAFILGHRDGLTYFADGVRDTLPLRRETGVDEAPARILDLERDPAGRLWVADGSQGLAVVETRAPGAGALFGPVRWIPGSAGLDGGVATVRRDRDGRLWVGGVGGLYRVQGGELRAAEVSPGPGIGVRRLLLDQAGMLHAATFGHGLFTLRDGRWERATSGEGVRTDQLYTATRYGGRLWIGSATGLLVATAGGALARPERDALRIEHPVYLLLADDRGRLWIGTDYGVYRWDGTRLEHFTGEDGLAGNEANRAAGHVDALGRVWIGTDRGLSRFDDRFEHDSVPPPEVALLALEADGAERPLTGPVRLGPGTGTVTFLGRAVSFVDEEGVHYRARLLGLDRAWTESVGSTRYEGRFRALPTGTYRFELQARSERSAWSPVVTSPLIRLVPPVWRRWWFYLLLVLLAGAAVFGASRVVEQRRYARTLEREVERRTADLVRSQKLESLGVLAGGIAHDFNNILTVVQGYVSLVRGSGTVGPENAELLGSSERALERARELTGRLLTFARGGAPVTGPVDLQDLVRESCEFATRGSSVVCRFDLPDELWPAQADAGQLSQVLSNLTLNAVQAMPDGGSLDVRAENTGLKPPDGLDLPPGRYVHLVVEDEGPGIAPEILPRIFDPFFTTKEGGSGLGLSTAYSIVQGHGGALTVDSHPGEGTRFDLHLPASIQPPAARPEEAVASPQPKGTGSILVMDDEEAVRSVLGAMLRRLGYDVELTTRGEEAVESYARRLKAGASDPPFDLVILDLTIPGGMGGVETVRRLREVDPRVVAVASSGYAHDPVMADHRAYGFAQVLPKPYTLQALSHVLLSNGARAPGDRPGD